jgi:hypothetical protein
MIRLSAVAFLVLSALGGCAVTYEGRIRGNLIEAGLSPSMAGCMAERMANRLSVSQLKSLGRLAGLRSRDIGEMDVEEFLRRSRALLDPKIYAVLTRAGLGCAIAG